MQSDTSPYNNLDAAADSFRNGSAALARSKDDLLKDFQSLINEGESLLKSTTSLSGEALAQARDKFRDKLNDAKTQVAALSDAAQQKGRQVVGATESYVRANPWPAVGMAVGLGILVGALSTRR
jgi:ElaB/YqjD/DUF883 family membrane-anchored ribosome-binding protein